MQSLECNTYHLFHKHSHMTHLLHVSDCHQFILSIKLVCKFYVNLVRLTRCYYSLGIWVQTHANATPITNERAVTGGKINVQTLDRVSYLRCKEHVLLLRVRVRFWRVRVGYEYFVYEYEYKYRVLHLCQIVTVFLLCLWQSHIDVDFVLGSYSYNFIWHIFAALALRPQNFLALVKKYMPITVLVGL